MHTHPAPACAEYLTCAAIAAVLDLSEQQCRLLLDTLAAVGGSTTVQGLEPMVNLHELSLFLLAQIYGREAHRCVAAPGGGVRSLGLGLWPRLVAVASAQPAASSAGRMGHALLARMQQARAGCRAQGKVVVVGNPQWRIASCDVHATALAWSLLPFCWLLDSLTRSPIHSPTHSLCLQA